MWVSLRYPLTLKLDSFQGVTSGLNNCSRVNCSFLYKLPIFARAISACAGYSQAMLIEAYIEVLLVDEELADQVWDAGEIDDLTV